MSLITGLCKYSMKGSSESQKMRLIFLANPQILVTMSSLYKAG